MIDLHCHVLPGIDDGPTTMAETIELGRVAWTAGFDTIVATPHVNWEHPNRAAGIAERVEEVNAAFSEAAVGVRVLAGAEVAVTLAHELSDEELFGLHLGDGPWLLLEAPLSPSHEALVGGTARQLQAAGHEIVLAHPERCPVFQKDFELLAGLVNDGMLCQITAASLVGRFGRTAQEMAMELLHQGMVHNVASDAHDPTRRPPSIAAELQESGVWPAAGRLAVETPQAILDGTPIPKAPVARRSRTAAEPAAKRRGLRGRRRR